MNQQNILQKAKEGNLTAIAEVLNYLFKDKNITAKVAQQNDCLRIILTGNDIPDQQSSIILIQQTMMRLELKSIHQVIVYGQQINHSAILWEQSLDVSDIVSTKQPNNPEENQEKSAPWFQWTPWFPYPGSWLRTLLLGAIAFPSISLIIWSFPGIILAGLTKNFFLVSIFTLTGIILPSVFLGGIYQLLFFQWQDKEWFKKYCTWWQKSHSFWEGFYGTFVFGISWLIIFCITWGLAVFYCQSYYNNHLTDYVNECSARSLKETMNAIIYFIEHPTNYSYRYRYYYNYNYNYELSASMLCGMWVMISAYLYQVEYVIRTKFTGGQIQKVILLVMLAFGLTQIIHFINIKSTEIRENATPISSPKITATPTPTITETPTPTVIVTEKPTATPTITETPTPKVIVTEKPAAKPTITVTPKPIPTEQPKIENDPFREAVNQAIKAAEMAQTAQTAAQWNLVVNEWQQAIALMKSVPESNSNYAVAQKKISEYEKYLNHAINQALKNK